MSKAKLSRRDFLKSAMLAAAGTVAASAAACQPAATPTAAPSTAPGATPAPTTAPAAQSGSIRIIGWGDATEVKARQETLDLFKQAKPNIKAEFLHTPDQYMTKLQTMLAGGDYPDVVYLGNGDVESMVDKKQLLPLDDLLKADKVDTSDIFPVNYSLYSSGGKQYGFPADAPSQQLFINLTMFKEAGIEPPSADWKDKGWNWAKFLEVSLKLTNASKKRWAFQTKAGNFRSWWIWITANGGEFFSKDGKTCLINQPAAVQAIQFLADLIHVHKVAPSVDTATELGSATMWESGITAMETWAPLIGRMRTNVGSKFEWDVVPHPMGAVGKTCSGGGSGHTLSANSKNQAAAWEFMKFSITKPYVDRWTTVMGIVPPLQSTAKSEVFLQPGKPPKNLQVFPEGNAYLRADPRHPKYTQAQSIVNTELDNVWVKNVKAQEACETITQKVNALLMG